ncbi:RrF2 family transcriptional regulator [Anaerotalea alkaliphila]|uniref:Rrf2 family transcriptional regulator n=1 Tax=Anaerotalea alkaliphila TaxID=2662126 RepID=A0A7X5HT48_9FIRM|nr:Rrf2 family transcriptional regulator [Anaerotalea alkaliphila]NDL66187.1 Rrf2 family transcriptional regulator [Anaerotalea alkaliphila]
MKLSTKGRYGLKMMIDLAIHSEKEMVSIKSISERQGISENYLEQIIALLKKAKLVESARGSKGGYSLVKPPEEVSVGEILRALEGNLSPVDCTSLNDGHKCEEADLCVTKNVWRKISDSINEVVDNIPLSELMDEQIKAEDTYKGEFQ